MTLAKIQNEWKDKQTVDYLSVTEDKKFFIDKEKLVLRIGSQAAFQNESGQRPNSDYQDSGKMQVRIGRSTTDRSEE